MCVLSKKWSTVSSAGTEDGLVSTLEDEDDLQASAESELVELNKVLGDVEDSSLRAKILSEVEGLVAKYRKCLSVAVQGKKLYQMVSIEKWGATVVLNYSPSG